MENERNGVCGAPNRLEVSTGARGDSGVCHAPHLFRVSDGA